MENISNQISYVKGLMDGLDFDENTKEGKVLKAMLAVFDEINDAFDDVYDFQDEMAEQIDMIDEDLAKVEEELIDDDCDCGCGDDMDYYEIECPNCGEIVCLDEDFLLDDEDLKCPNCGEPIEIDFDCDCDCDDDGCDCCGHDHE